MTITQVRPSPAPDAEPAPPAPRRAWLPVLFVIAGVLVLLYPVAATQFNNYKQNQFAEEYGQQVEQADPVDLRADLERARAYNATLEGVPILDPWLTQVSSNPNSEAYRGYLGQLSRFDAMARVRVPAVNIDLPTYHGTTDPVLAKGVGHLYGTSLPVGGENTHAVMTSHTALATATLFDNLSEVEKGDVMYVDVLGETLAYEVDQIKVILPDQLDDLSVVEGEDYITLFTCTPYAVNSHRLLVRGVRVPYDPTAEGATPGGSPLQIQGWMWWLILGAAAGLLLLLVLVAREVRQRRRRARAAEAGTAGTPGSPDLHVD